MKKLIITIIIPLLSFSQLDYTNYITSNYVEEMEWNSKTNQYDVKEQMFKKVELFPEKKYYSYKINYGQTEQYFYWEFLGKDELNMDVYFNNIGEKIIFDYENNEIWFFSSYNEFIKKFTQIKILSNIKFKIKKGEYIPQTRRNYIPSGK